ncbi:cytochrome P450 [Micromonospora zhanjiangensis]|uniref:Cytochrome P450 n=1 Tax=Micromonospora zhanjiangensis TaxID=1522057 RepID=A0ABV8KVP5_9ACTN
METDARTELLTVADLAGPPGLPVVGNLPAFARGAIPHRRLYGWREKYGATFRMRFPGTDVVVTSEPGIIDTVLRDRPTSFRRARFVSDLIDELGAHGLFNAESDDWRRLRRIAMRGLNAKYVRASFGTILRSAGRLRDRWGALEGQRIDVVDELLRYTLEVSIGLTMGHQPDAGLHRKLSLVFSTLGRRLNSPLPYWRWMRLPADRRTDTAVAEIGELILSRYAEARRRMADGAEPVDFLTALAKADLDGEDPLDDADVVGNVLTMVVAGEDTTAAAAAWTLHFLATHPDVQRRVRAEAAEVFGGDGSLVDASAVSRLTYAEAVVNEAMRLRAPAPYLVMEPVADTTVTDGTRELSLTRGTPVFVLLTYGAETDTGRYPDPEAFRPDRWLTQDAPVPGAQPHLPFGNGPRFCPGRNLALLETTLLAAMTCQSFVIEPDTSAGPVKERMTFALFPKNLGVRMRPVSS